MEKFQKLGISIVLALFGLVSLSGAFRTCGELGLCCPGHNNTCYAFGPRLDAKESVKCFCDEECRKYGDCCIDIQQACEDPLRVDCEVGDWQRDGDCSEQCGRGIQKYKREIITHPKHGGRQCPRLRKKTTCEGKDCTFQEVTYQGKELKEMGRIIPSKYGVYRASKKYSPYRDIRKNLFDFSNEIPRRPAYCAYYKIVESRRSCNTTLPNLDWAIVMQPGEQVCVECQPFVMHKELGVRCKGHGVYQEITRWNAVGVPHCHGKWKMLTKHEPCTCNLVGEKDFILL